MSESAKMVSTTVYITKSQKAQLDALRLKTRVPVAEYVREGVSLVLDKNQDILQEALEVESGEDDEEKIHSASSEDGSEHTSSESIDATS